VNEHGLKLGASFDNVLPTLGRDRVRISFTVARRGDVNLGVYDAAGLLVRTLVNGTLERGSQSATWDRTNSSGRRVANGAYFYRLTVDGKTVSSKSVLFN
jgi:flagellar hook assembly protein FlgD